MQVAGVVVHGQAVRGDNRQKTLMSIYRIAGHLLEGNLDMIPGFPVFRSEKEDSDKEPLLRFDPADSSREQDLRFALWIAFGEAALHRRTVAVHASTVMYGGKSILFLGESGTGKSTHTQFWLQHIPDTELLNDDSPFLNISNGIRVYGSPWSGKTPCYKAQQTPVAALVRLRQAPCNKIRRLGNLEAIGAILPSFPPQFAGNEELSAYMHEILSAVLQQIPVYSLDCLPDTSAAELVFNTLRQDGRL